ncbi:sulfite exporter TauE/SafE family protein [Clostridium magnum]|uniref:Heavy-metal-associated domain protein n=1 Tax=Clostridium magnum DSM 2767 TaxID=1121326 RepID=A0A161YX73_9CLOT|nr:sulfite exporter TauE/SafE family protein [Clostridium magnum]KZL91447.1 heavy-metal-associated domain protein [Clostridium magnum DSM 2767]SHH42639.1 Sulfite exporter TauE/SafE [Clostridium magnum DSM 2767]
MSIKNIRLKVYNMTCTSCEKTIERTLKKLVGVFNVKANYSGQFVEIEYDSDLCSLAEIKSVINNAGYSTQNSSNFGLAGILMIAVAIILIGNSTGGFDMNNMLKGATYFVLFVVGVLTSIHCVGMCGGIMLSQSLSNENTNKFAAIKPALLYNVGRVISYTVLGAIVGALGSVLSLSIKTQAALQIFAGLFMIIMGFNMAGFSLFRKLQIKLPWSFCSIKNKPKTPFMVGILNGLMPCGPLQTMQLYALGTGSAAKGALSMFIFALGTVPLMLTFGAVSGLLSKGYTKKILKFSGVLVIVLGFIMGNRGLSLAGINFVPPMASLLSGNSQSLAASGSNSTKAVLKDGVQVINMTADGNGYSPNVLYVKKGIPVKWIIDGKQITSCNNAIVVPSLNIKKQLDNGENVIEFTPEDKDLNFSCWMGMIRGVIRVVDDLDSVDTSKVDPSAPPAGGGGCCGGPVPPSSNSSTTPQTPSIYGSDLSTVSTETIVNTAMVIGKNQSATIKGIGYEFKPLIVVVNKDIKTKLTFDLTSFDNPDGKFELVSAKTADTFKSFDGKKGVVDLDITFSELGGYGIVKDGRILGIIEVVDDIKNADLEKIRQTYTQ